MKTTSGQTRHIGSVTPRNRPFALGLSQHPCRTNRGNTTELLGDAAKLTTSDFSKGAREEATRPDAVPVALMNGEQLVALMMQNEVMVTRHSHDIFDLTDEASNPHLTD